MGNVTRYGIYSIASIFFFLCFQINVNAQDSDRELAFQQIENLKSGALIVRLRVNSKKVAAYQSVGNDELANKLIEKQRQRNFEMMAAFISNFDYCPVYFIYANDYIYLNDGLKKGFFVGENLEVDTSIVLNELNYFYCDFGTVYQQALANQTDGNTKMVTSTPMLQEALVIKNKQLTQLLDPFPFYAKVRFYEFDNAVNNLNQNLFKFLGKTWAKEQQIEEKKKKKQKKKK